MKYKLLRLTLMSLLMMLCGSAFADEVTMKYSGSTTTNMTGENDAALLGLDATEWNVIADKGAASFMPGLNKAGNIRLYWHKDGGNTITVQNLSGKTISSIAITYADPSHNNAYVAVDGNKVKGEDGVYAINGSAFVIGNANTSSAQVHITQIVINYSDASDTRTATNISLGDHATTGNIGASLSLPSAALVAGEGNMITDATLTWDSSDKTVATINTETNTISLLAAGTTTIKVEFAGNDTYKPSSASYTLTVKDAKSYTSIAKMLEEITATKTDIEYTFTGICVTYVNGSYTYIHSPRDGDMLLYGSSLGLEQGAIYNGSLTGQLYTYNGLPEIAVNAADVNAVKQEGTMTIDIAIITVDQLSSYLNKMCTIQNAEFVSADGKNLTFKVGDTEFTARNNFNLSTETLTAGTKYEITGFGGVFNNAYQIYPTQFNEEIEAPTFPKTAKWDFSGSSEAATAAVFISGTNNSIDITSNGLILTVEANGQTIRDNGNSIQTGDGVVFKVPVQGKKDVVTVEGFPGYFAYSIAGVDAETATTSYTAKAADVAQGYVEIVNKGQYLISISVTQNEDEEPAIAKDVVATWDFQNKVPATIVDVNIQGTKTEKVASDVEGIEMTVISEGGKLQYNASGYAQFNVNTTLQIPVKNAGDIVAVVSYPGQSNYTVGGEDATGKNEFEYTAKANDATKGYVEIIPTSTAYLYAIKVLQKAPQGAVVLDNEPVTATFPFNLGTEGQTATFTNGDYFLNSKVTHGDGVILEGKDNKSLNQTWFNVAAKDSKANDGNAINFIITPKPGLTFTPTNVSFKSTRYGTNGGKLDIAWKNSDGTLVSLATAEQPLRDNATPNVSEFSYEVGAKASDGACGLQINLYSLDPGKHVGFSEIIINGTLSGEEKALPILASFKINGKEYAADDFFSTDYEATLKLSKKEAMVSAENPLTDVTAASGEIGTITYEGTETSCKVTIPMTAGTVNQDYVLNIVQKPDYTLTYLAVDGSELTKQTVEEDAAIGEFAYDIANVQATKEGYKARGWFKQNYVGAKYATTDVVTANATLYAVETEIEVPSNSRKYVYDLTNANFFDEDHEGFNSVGSGHYHNNHGWAFNNGDKIELLVGKKATINFTLCQYSKEGATISASNGAEISAVAQNDGGSGSFDYEGEEGTLTLTINSTGAVYMHGITVFNTSEPNFIKQGDWIIVKNSDASSLLDAIEVAKGIEGAKIFLPNGTYDLGNTVKTIISGKNVSLIGQSAENTIITTKPVEEGLDKADLLKNTGEGLYMQDISLKNNFSYGGNDGRAASLHDTGTKTVCKNVFLLSYQDTYYSHKVGGLYYFEGGELHGTVDYLCGNGKVYYDSVKLVNEVRGSATITANSEMYVFNNCTVENNATTYNLGRAWSDHPVCVYLNTTLLDPDRLVSTRWNLSGINCDYSVAGEYGTKNAAGENITPASNTVTFTKENTTINTILDATALETYSIENVLGEWATTAKAEATQVAAPSDAELATGKIQWTAVDGATAYAVFKNDVLVAITEGTSVEIGTKEDGDTFTIRSANQRGGFGKAAAVKEETTIIHLINPEALKAKDENIYNISGQRINAPQKGINIINGKKVIR
ncbi:MAG: InlB B-repeat-containing protein [Prevotella sp.]|nr:InlB B-repeat-containing protein [Prevotella sp.]